MDVFLPPLDGALPTIPDIADFHAIHNPDNPWFLFPSRDSPEKLVSITYHEMVQASHRVAHIMRPNREGPDREIIALLLHTDSLLYVAVILGLLRAGFVVRTWPGSPRNMMLTIVSSQPYPMSPRNSPQGVIHMLETVSCTRILAQVSISAFVHQVQNEMEAKGAKIRIDELPGLSEMFPQLAGKISEASAEVKPYPASDKPIDGHAPSIYFHSSGSTGYPKSIHLTYRRMLQCMASSKFVRCLQYLSAGSGDCGFAGVFGSSRDMRYAGMGAPTFHAMGMLLQLTYPLSTGREVVIYTPQYPAPPVVPHPQNVYEVSKLAQCTALSATPSFVDVRLLRIYRTMRKTELASKGMVALSRDHRVPEDTHRASQSHSVSPDDGLLTRPRSTAAARLPSPPGIS